MISRVLEYTKKYYPITAESIDLEIVADGIEGTFAETYYVGQYVNIDGSILNDGTYKITAVSSTKLTLDATLVAEDSDDIVLWGLALPNGLLDIVSSIENYQAGIQYGIKSESQGQRSVTYGSESGDNTWQSVFKNPLAPYKAIYDDRRGYCSQFNINTKR